MGLAGVRARSLKESRESWAPVLTGPGSPAPHSSLAADDAVFTPMGCSAIAWSGLRQAVDAFDRATGLLDADSTGPVTDAVVELRTALAQVSHALTVLSPRRSERVCHALRIAWTAFSGPDERSPSLTSLVPFPSPLVVTEVRSLLTDRSFEASPRWFEISSVRVATGHLRQRVADPDLLEATVRFMWDIGPDEQPLRDDAVACAETVVLMIERALELWSVRAAPAPQLALGSPSTGSSSTGTATPSTGGSPFRRSDEVTVDPFSPPAPRGRRRRTL